MAAATVTGLLVVGGLATTLATGNPIGVDCDPKLAVCVHDFPGLDVIRIFAIAAGFFMTVMLARLAYFRKNMPLSDFDRNMFYALMCMGLLFSTQELAQLGANFVVWRLPLILLTLWFGWRAIIKKL